MPAKPVLGYPRRDCGEIGLAGAPSHGWGRRPISSNDAWISRVL
jgi:hypothetical protein